MPACCRAVGARVHDDGSTLTVWLPVATSQAIVTDLATNPRIAIAMSEPISHETIQIKGRTCAVRLAGSDERNIVSQQMERLADVLEQLGMPRRVTSRISRWPAFAIDVSVDEVYDQTPGPRAGRLVR
jgi:hypothetical protein